MLQMPNSWLGIKQIFPVVLWPTPRDARAVPGLPSDNANKNINVFSVVKITWPGATRKTGL